MALLRPWFLVRGSKRSRLDEGPSSSNRTVNSRCSEIDPNTTERSPPFPAASAQQRRSIPMELLPVELRKTLPPLYSQESCPTPIVHVKLFTPDSSFTWYVTEGAEQEGGDGARSPNRGMPGLFPEGVSTATGRSQAAEGRTSHGTARIG